MFRSKIKMLIVLALTGGLTACSETEQRDTKLADQPIEISAVAVSQILLDCPLEITHLQADDTDVEYLDKDGNLVKEIHGAYDEVYDIKISGLCPETGETVQRIDFKTDIAKPLQTEFSKFTVIDDEYTTTDLSEYFSYDAMTNDFFITPEKASDMWSSLRKSRYEFSINLISDDYEIAEIYSFNFEIR